jgi:hypothetical protein
LRKTIAATAVLVAMALVVAAASGQGGHPRSPTHARALPAGPPPTASAASRYHRFRGTVTSVRRGRWFGMHTTTNRRVRIYVNGSTHWDGCDWDDMHRGYHMTCAPTAATVAGWPRTCRAGTATGATAGAWARA